MHQVEFWFDPICPFAWVTSRWLLEAAKVRQIEITWKQMSLAALNEGKDLDEAYRQKVQRSWGPGRVIDAVIEGEGEGALGALYTAYGMAIHEEGNEIGPKLNERALGEAGLNAQYAQEAQNEDRDEHLRARQREVEALVGNEVGTPVLGGISYREAHLAMEMVCQSGKLLGMDLVEVNPILDSHNVTAELAVEFALSALGKRVFLLHDVHEEPNKPINQILPASRFLGEAAFQ